MSFQVDERQTASRGEASNHETPQKDQIDSKPDSRASLSPKSTGEDRRRELAVRNPNSQVMKMPPKNVNVLLNYNPASDQAYANSLNNRTYLSYMFSIVMLIVFVGCLATIVIDSKNEYENMVMNEALKIENCLKSYEENRCHPHQRVPALNDYCLDLEMCLNADPRKVAKHTTAFSTLVAENANKIFGSLQWKTIFVICIFVFGTIITCNLIIGRGPQILSSTQVRAKSQ